MVAKVVFGSAHPPDPLSKGKILRVAITVLEVFHGHQPSGPLYPIADDSEHIVPPVIDQNYNDHFE